MTVINVSDGGLLAEGVVRLLPGTHIDVHVIAADGRVLVRSRVVRASVCDVQPDFVRYRGALAFDRSLDTALPLSPATLDGSLTSLAVARNTGTHV